jgi:hypothetical protein
MDKMTNKEQVAAGAALMDWFESQGIAPLQAAEIMHFMLYAIMQELAEECHRARSS